MPAWGEAGMVAPGRGRWFVGLLLVAGVTVPPAAPGGAEISSRVTLRCVTDGVPVALGPGRPADQRIVVELCGAAPGRVVQVLMSGATYGPTTWDLPYQPERYSYVRAMNEAGIATLNVTRLGMAGSSHPHSSEVTTDSQIHIFSQLIDAVRGGRFGVAFDKVVIVGHSYGGVIAYGVGNRHAGKVDGVIIAGLQHEFDPAFLREFWGNLHSANEEGGRFANLDDGYLTSRPGQRHTFYRQDQVDPKIIEMDEATKETFTREDARTFPPVMGESEGITAPVLVLSSSAPAQAERLVQADLRITIGTLELGEALSGTNVAPPSSLRRKPPPSGSNTMMRLGEPAERKTST